MDNQRQQYQEEFNRQQPIQEQSLVDKFAPMVFGAGMGLMNQQARPWESKGSNMLMGAMAGMQGMHSSRKKYLDERQKENKDYIDSRFEEDLYGQKKDINQQNLAVSKSKLSASEYDLKARRDTSRTISELIGGKPDDLYTDDFIKNLTKVQSKGKSKGTSMLESISGAKKPSKNDFLDIYKQKQAAIIKAYDARQKVKLADGRLVDFDKEQLDNALSNLSQEYFNAQNQPQGLDSFSMGSGQEEDLWSLEKLNKLKL